MAGDFLQALPGIWALYISRVFAERKKFYSALRPVGKRSLRPAIFKGHGCLVSWLSGKPALFITVGNFCGDFFRLYFNMMARSAGFLSMLWVLHCRLVLRFHGRETCLQQTFNGRM